MNTVCNYRCTYCTQRFLDDRKQWARDLPRFIDAFGALPGAWEIKLSGGEPFQHPDFLGAVDALIRQGRTLSVVTNFSASPLTLERYAAITEPAAGVFSASLHLEYVDALEFRDRLRAFARMYAGPVVATVVATLANLPRLPALVEAFAAVGLTLRVQPEKQDREVIDYPPQARALLRSLGGHNGTGWLAPSFLGQPCGAGSRYFIVDHRGEAWRCYPARRRRSEHLGNLLDGSFQRYTQDEPCRYHYCNCTVPIQRGLVGGGRDTIAEE